jgi:hypothetical protein
MFLLFTILSKLMLVCCGMLIGAWITYGYTNLILIGIIMSIGLYFAYFFIAGHYIKADNKVHIRELHYGDNKPDEMSDEIWEKVQALLQVTACPDKLEPASSKDYEDEP